VDIIVKSPAYHFAFEIKYREKAQAERLGKAYLVTKRDGNFGVTDLPGGATCFLRVPAHILCYFLGQAEISL
jgi:hypothetical protein